MAKVYLLFLLLILSHGLSGCQGGMVEGFPQVQTACIGTDCKSTPVKWSSTVYDYQKDFVPTSDLRDSETGQFNSVCFDQTYVDAKKDNLPICQYVYDTDFQNKYGATRPVAIQSFRLQTNIEEGIVFKGGWVRTSLIDLDESTGEARFSEEQYLHYPRVTIDANGSITEDFDPEDIYCELNAERATAPADQGLSLNPGPNYQVGFKPQVNNNQILTGMYLVSETSLTIEDEDDRLYHNAHLSGATVSVAGIVKASHSLGTSLEFDFPSINDALIGFGLYFNFSRLTAYGSDIVNATSIGTNGLHYTRGGKWYSFTFGKDYLYDNDGSIELRSRETSDLRERVITGLCLNGFKKYKWNEGDAGTEVMPLLVKSKFRAHKIFINN